MAHTAHKSKDMMVEHMDPPDVLEEKMLQLEGMVRESRRIVVFTGAGISTSAGIPDFRGPTGVWTRKAQGQPPIAGTSTVKALPTKTHMALVELYRRGVVGYVISQNCDGLHRRSGLPATAISELHGNSNIEICEDCGLRFFRDFKAIRREHTFDHFTGRFCHCSGRLLDSTIDFGQNLPTVPLTKAKEKSELADLHIVLGSSLTVSPACDLPKTTAKRGGKLVIVNLQKTPLSSHAALEVHAPTDDVMVSLMRRLEVPVPNFRLERRIIFGREAEEVFVKAVDVHNPACEIGVLCGVDWDEHVREIHESERTQAVWKHVSHRHPVANLDTHQLRPTLHFVGHYQEPSLSLNIDLSSGNQDVLLAFDPLSAQWEVTGVQAVNESSMCSPVSRFFDAFRGKSGAAEGEDRDCEYGASHRQYVISKRREQGAVDAAGQVDEEFRKSRERAERFADEAARDRARSRACMILKQHKQIQKILAKTREQVAEDAVEELDATPISEYDPKFGTKCHSDKLHKDHFEKIPTPEHRATMVSHTKSCKHDGCRTVWQGRWGSFIGGRDGTTHFDLTECPEGKRLNQVIGWNYDNPAC